MFDEMRRKEPIALIKGLVKTPLRVGVLFSGGPAAGGANVIAGLFDAASDVVGFLGGPSGLLEEKYRTLSKEDVDRHRNLGGFDLLGTGRTKIETNEQFAQAKRVTERLGLQGLVIIGGDDSNTNAYFLHKKLSCKVIGVPKTIDGDLQTPEIAMSFGFDTACKVYSELISNICIDAKSSLKYWHFIKLMGRTASHVTLECALQTRPNMALIGEEVRAKQWTLDLIVHHIADMVDARAKEGKNYGVILIPEGLIEFVGDAQIRGDLDSHGNVKVSQIETEKLLSEKVAKELQQRGSLAKFTPSHHFFGYEGRCGYPSLFDATYCYNLGWNAARLIHEGKSGVISAIRNLHKDPSAWEATHSDIEPLLHEEVRKGEKKQVLAKTLVNLHGPVFKSYEKVRSEDLLKDRYLRPAPIQFHGPEAHAITHTVALSSDR